MLRAKGPDLSKENYWQGWANGDSRIYVRVYTIVEAKAFDEALQRNEKSFRDPICRDGAIVVHHDHLHIAVMDLRHKFKIDGKAFVSCQELNKTLEDYRKVENIKNTYAVCATVQKVNGVWITLSLYTTWLYLEDAYILTQDAINQMSKPCQRKASIARKDGSSYEAVLNEQMSVVSIMHGNPKNVKFVMEEIYRQTIDILRWRGEHKKELFDLIAKMIHLINHQDPWWRGGGAIPENGLRVLLLQHAIKVIANAEETNLFFECHAHPMTSVFLREFHKQFKYVYTKPVEFLNHTTQ